MKKEDLKVTRGSVEVVGIIAGIDRLKGVDNEKPYEKETQNGKKYREISFNVMTGEGESARVRIKSFKNDYVYYSNEDNETEKIAWKERKSIPKGCKPYGQISFHGTGTKEDGKSKVEYVLDYDAIPAILNSFKDGDPVRLAGNIEYYSTSDKTYKSIDITRLYHSRDDIDFSDDEFSPLRKFKQTIIFEDYDKVDDKHMINCKVITNKKDGDSASLSLEINPLNDSMINAFKKVKPGTEMTVRGDFFNKASSVDVDTLKDDDEYGFTDSDDYGDLADEYKDGVNGYDDVWVIMFVPTKDADGNKLIHTAKYDLDDIAEWKAEVLDAKEDKKNNSGASNSSQKSKDDDEEEWGDLD